MLVIVDTQRDFESVAIRCLAGLSEAVYAAIKQEMPIAVLEYVNCGDTLRYIKRWLPKDQKYIKKVANDGSREVLENFSPSGPIYVCGVNGLRCVRETAQGFYSRGYDVRVITSATADCEGDHWVGKFKHFCSIPLVDKI